MRHTTKLIETLQLGNLIYDNSVTFVTFRAFQRQNDTINSYVIDPYVVCDAVAFIAVGFIVPLKYS